MTPRLGSLCTGYGGLDLAVAALLPVEHAWHAEVDPAAATVLAAHWPHVPNLGDITTADWTAIEQVDVLTAGFPCQPFSLAGKRAGTGDDRHLWPTGVLPAIAALRPALVVLENVPGLLTIQRGDVFGTVLADLDRLGYHVAWTTVGACRVGACHHRHRIFLAATLVATDPPDGVLFGTPLAAVRKWPQAGFVSGGMLWDLPADVCGADGAVLPTPTATPYGNNQSLSPGAAVRPSLEGVVQMLPTPTARIADGRGTPNPGTAQARMDSGRRNLEDAVALLPTQRVSATRTGRSAILGSSSAPSLEQALELARGEMPRELRSWGEAPASWRPLPTPTPTARDAGRGSGSGKRYPEGRPLSEVVALLPTPRASDTGTPGRRASEGWRPPLSQVILGAASDARGVGPMLPTPRASDAAKGGPNQRGSSGDIMLPAAVQPSRFGAYEAAVRRQEAAFGLPAPDPTEAGRNGKPRLSPAFPEWMVGLPPGWITDHVGRNDAIRIAGNGVVWQAAAHALTTLATFHAIAAAPLRGAA